MTEESVDCVLAARQCSKIESHASPLRVVMGDLQLPSAHCCTATL
jgi:hypothetical protein